MTSTVGMVGPLAPAQLGDLLDPSSLEFLPEGLGGPPVNLLVRELVGRGRPVIAITFDREVSEEQVLEGPNLKICVGPYRPRPARDLFAAERTFLRRVLRREAPDVVHTHWTYEWALATQASGLPHVITAHDAPLSVLRFDFGPYRVAKTLIAYRVLPHAKRVVSVSPYVANHLSRFMLYRGPWEVIPNGMPQSLFARVHEQRPAGRPITFASSLNGWGRRKNGQIALEAFAHLRRHRPEARLIMFGHGHGPGQGAQQWAIERGFEKGIEFAGRVAYSAAIDRIASEVDVFVHPALEEAQGMVLLEAMALGIPVIAGEASGGTRWTLGNGRAGILVDVTDSRSVARAMDDLAGDAEARVRFGRQGSDFARQRFHIHAVADAYERVYAEVHIRG
jgi:glycosyltransferase involved in cell wall biosynthesis